MPTDPQSSRTIDVHQDENGLWLYCAQINGHFCCGMTQTELDARRRARSYVENMAGEEPIVWTEDDRWLIGG